MLPLLALLFSLSLSVPQATQAQSGRHFMRTNKSLRSVTLDLGAGTLTRGGRVQDRAASTVVDFSNVDLGGFVGVDSGGGACEWFEAGVKGTGTGATMGVMNDSDLMNSIVFAYCSAKLDTRSGGLGGSVKLGFYEGYTTFGTTPTTAVATMTLTGLPANTRSSSYGGFNCAGTTASRRRARALRPCSLPAVAPLDFVHLARASEVLQSLA
jgi:outer membrane lipoprotein SlyB